MTLCSLKSSFCCDRCNDLNVDVHGRIRSGSSSSSSVSCAEPPPLQQIQIHFRPCTFRKRLSFFLNNGVSVSMRCLFLLCDPLVCVLECIRHTSPPRFVVKQQLRFGTATLM